MARMVFAGFPAAAFEFYQQLELDNTRSFWLENKHVYDSAIKEPFAELSGAVTKPYGALRLFRPYRDVRFAKDKTPYKTQAGAVGESEGGVSFYVAISATGMYVGSGMYQLSPDQLDRWRTAVDNAKKGAAIEKVTATLRSAGYEIGSMEALKTAPRGFAKDHPRVELLRMKGLTSGRSFPNAKWIHTANALDRITGAWDDAKPLRTWLERNVGPSTEAPPEPD